MREKKYEEMTNLKKLIKRKNISYRKLAEDMQMSLNAINNKLNGYTVFNIYEAEKTVTANLLINDNRFSSPILLTSWYSSKIDFNSLSK